MEGGPSHQLDVVVALADHPAGRFPDDPEGLDQQVVEVLPPIEPLTELDGPVAEGVVVEALQLRLDGVDVGHEALERPEHLALARAEDAIEKTHAAGQLTGTFGAGSRRQRGGRGPP